MAENQAPQYLEPTLYERLKDKFKRRTANAGGEGEGTPDGDGKKKMTTAEKWEMGVSGAAIAADIGMKAFAANREAKAKAKEDKEEAVVAGMQAGSNAAGNRAVMEQNALHNLMRVGR